MNNCLFKSFNPFLLDVRWRLIHGKYVMLDSVTSNTNRTLVTFYFSLQYIGIFQQPKSKRLSFQDSFFFEIPNWLMFAKCLDYWNDFQKNSTRFLILLTRLAKLLNQISLIVDMFQNLSNYVRNFMPFFLEIVQLDLIFLCAQF